jgi:hypothetical protein
MDGNVISAVKREMAALAMHARFPGIDEIENEIPQLGVAYWRSLRKGRKFPARADVTPRGLGTLLRNTLLIGVIDGGSDYTFRIVGDAVVVALGQNFQGRPLSELDRIGNMHGGICRRLYGGVVKRGEPQAICGCMGANLRMRIPIQCEGAFLPLGPDETAVNYILGFTVCVSHSL